MSLAKAVKGKQRQDGGEEARGPTQCIANGCPLPGVFRISNDSSICRAHDEQPPAYWGSITTRVRNRIESLQRAIGLTNDVPGELAKASDERFFVERHGSEFAVRSGADYAHGCETSRGYGARVLGKLMTECRVVSAVPDVKPRPAGEMQKVAEHIERVAP